MVLGTPEERRHRAAIGWEVFVMRSGVNAQPLVEPKLVQVGAQMISKIDELKAGAELAAGARAAHQCAEQQQIELTPLTTVDHDVPLAVVQRAHDTVAQRSRIVDRVLGREDNVIDGVFRHGDGRHTHLME